MPEWAVSKWTPKRVGRALRWRALFALDYAAAYTRWLIRRAPVTASNFLFTLGIGSPPSVTILGDFDTGVVDPALSSITNPATATPAVHLVMRLAAVINDPGGSPGASPRGGYWHHSSKLIGMAGKTPTFDVAIDDGVHSKSTFVVATAYPTNVSSPVAFTWKPWYSYDQITWFRFDNSTHSGTGTSSYFGQFSNNTPFTDDTVYVRHQPAFTTAYTATRVAALNGNALVSSTTSWEGVSSVGAAKFKVGATTTFSDEQSRAIGAFPLYGFKISSGGGNAPDGFPKRKVLFLGPGQPCEQAGGWCMWGAIDQLLAGDTVANSALARFDFYCYPLMNPAGVYAGYWRQDPHAPTLDANRHWLVGDNAVEFSTLLRSRITTDVGGDISALISWHEADVNGFGTYEAASNVTSGIITSWAAALSAAATAISYSTTFTDYGDTSPVTAEIDWTDASLHADLSVSVEAGPYFVSTTGDYAKIGQIGVRALTTLYDNGKLPHH